MWVTEIPVNRESIFSHFEKFTSSFTPKKFYDTKCNCEKSLLIFLQLNPISEKEKSVK